jgi:hypothetical protein
MKRKKIKESLEELRSRIETLDKFHVKAEKIATFNEPYWSNSRISFALPIDTIRSNAKRLHDVLAKTWCSNYSSHLAGLLLEQRLVKSPKRRGANWQRKRHTVDRRDTSCFGLFLLQPPTSMAKKWLDVEIRLVESSVSREQSEYAFQGQNKHDSSNRWQLYRAN